MTSDNFTLAPNQQAETTAQAETTTTSLARAGALTAAQQQEILAARARVLAREPLKEETNWESLEVVVFTLASEQYAVETSFIREVYPLRELTPLPCTPAHVLGIISVRGQILPVLDLKRVFHLPLQGISDQNKVIILGRDEPVLGLLADMVWEVRSIPLAAIHATPPTLQAGHGRYLHGVTTERLALIDAAALLSDPALVVDETVGS